MNIRLAKIACSLLLVSTQAGCLALNVPSQRYHDPADHGGVFGAWNRHHGSQHSAGGPSAEHGFHDADQIAAETVVAGNVDDGCLLGDPLHHDPFDSSVAVGRKPEEPEIPWPRFHPIPTRPVFGPSNP
tara:strand:+ start:381643 stop:382029 length:387 start_codon:yes stop_codon:yes gene_type:complete